MFHLNLHGRRGGRLTHIHSTMLASFEVSQAEDAELARDVKGTLLLTIV